MSALIDLYPQLDACIETQAKRRFKATGERLLKGEKGNLEQEHEILRSFLETQDFNKLRADSEPHLVAGKRVKYTVGLKNGKSVYEMKVE